MIKRINKRISFYFLLTLILIIPLVSTVHAKEELAGYTIDTTSLPDEIKPYISSLALIKENDYWVLEVNNDRVSKGTSLSFEYSPEININFKFDFNLAGNVKITYSFTNTAIFTSAFKLDVSDAIQTVKFYPDVNSSNNIYKEASLVNGFYDFGDFNCVLNGKSLAYNLRIDANNKIAYITKNGSVQTYLIDSPYVTELVFLETHVNQHTLAEKYLKMLTPKSFSSAKSIQYSSGIVDSLASNEILTLRHKKSGLTYDTPLRRVISIWTRLGEESYDTRVLTEHQVVCQWNEDVCSVIRNSGNREFLVLGDSYSYNALIESSNTVDKTIVVTLYKNIKWPSSSTIESSTWPSTTNQYTFIRYKERYGEWGNYSDYIYGSSDACDNDKYCSSKSQTKYAKSTRTYGPYSQAQRSTGSVSSWSSFISGTTPSNTNSYRYRSYYKYTCRSGKTLANAYSTIMYSAGSRGPCDSGYTITTRTNGYQSGAVNWSDYVDVSSCSASTGYYKCKTVTKYKYSDWSSYSGYIYDSCTADSYTQCKSQSKYAYRYINWGDWSAYKKTTSPVTSSQTHEVSYQYNKGVYSWDDYKGPSTIIGFDTYYTGESKEENKTTGSVNLATTTSRTVGSLTHKKESDIIAIAQEIGKNAQLIAIKNHLGSQAGYQEVIDYYNKNPNAYISTYETAYNEFLNSSIFVPYIYVLDHYRAVSREMEIKAFKTTLNNVSTITNTNSKVSNSSLIPYYKNVSRETKVIYFDFKDPFYNYQSLPENWQGYENVVEKIKNSDLSNYEITIKLTKDDLAKMKQYINSGGSIDDCSFIRKFSNIFYKTNAEFDEWLTEGKGCTVGDSTS